eukprot:1157661-Pelagomonas_calceolata.AAC.11
MACMHGLANASHHQVKPPLGTGAKPSIAWPPAPAPAPDAPKLLPAAAVWSAAYSCCSRDLRNGGKERKRLHSRAYL